MAEHLISFIFDTRLPFLRSSNKLVDVEETYLFDVISSSYLPFLRTLAQFEQDKIPVKIAVAFSPCLCDMLSDSLLQDKYIDRLHTQIDFAKTELERLKDNPTICEQIEETVALFQQNLHDFRERYQKNLLKGFSYFISNGMIELLATTATTCFLPLYADIPQAIAAQIEVGLLTCRKFFSTVPAGFWLPRLGYTPGLEKTIKAYGFDYTIVDASGFMLSNANLRAGVFAPVLAKCGLKALARDNRACFDIAFGEKAYCKNSIYLDKEKDIAFELQNTAVSRLFPKDQRRCTSGFQYWDKQGDYYNSQTVDAQIVADATHFIDNRQRVFPSLETECEVQTLSSVIALPLHFFGHSWYEGLKWFDAVCRKIVQKTDIKVVQPLNIIRATRQLQQCELFFSSGLRGGYATDLLNHTNDWMYARVRKATQQMIRLADRFADDKGLRERILNIAAREVLLAQSVYWQLLSNDELTREYAAKHFNDHIEAFTTVYDALGSGLGNTGWLSSREKEIPIFKDINYHVFVTKK